MKKTPHESHESDPIVQADQAKAGDWRGHLRSVLQAFFLSRRLRPLLVLGAVCYLVFVGFRVGLLLASLKLLPDSSAAEIARCFVVGLGFDTMAIGYLLLPLVVLMSLTAASTFDKKWLRRCVGTYVTLATILVVTIELVGMAYFMYYRTRINWVLPYYVRNPHEVLGYVWNEYPLWLVVPVPPIAFWAIYRAYAKVLWHGRKPVTQLQGWRKWALATLLAGLCVLACRGGVGSRPLNFSKLYDKSSNQMVVELGKNNSYTLYYGLMHMFDAGQDEKGLFGLLDIEDAQPIVSKMLYQKQDKPLGRAGNPLWRQTDTGQAVKNYNVVVIIMESMAGKYVGALGYKNSLTPNLDAICRGGLYFNRLYAVGARTSRGMVGTLCGYPDLCWRTVLDRELAVGNFLTLPGMLKGRGYSTTFVYGGDPKFDNMGPFFSVGGVDTIIGEQDIRVLEASTWGVSDEYIFGKTLETLDKKSKQAKPFFSVVLTLSNHEPFDVPAGRIKLLPTDKPKNKIINATRYADWALGEFFSQARSKPWFDETIFVLVADTGRTKTFDRTRILDAARYRIPCVFYAPGIIKPRRVNTVASQADIAPTILSMLGGKYEHCFMGRNLLKVSPGDGFALLHEDDRLAFIRGENLLVQPPRSKPLLYKLSLFNTKPAKSGERVPEELAREMLSFYMVARDLYIKGLYNRKK